MGRKDKRTKGVQSSVPPTAQEYDLLHSLKAIRRRSSKANDTVESTKTDVRVGSINVNIYSNPETNSETQSQMADNYATEQYVQSLVNNLQADQINSSTRLMDAVNKKIDPLVEKIEAVKNTCLSKDGFWTGIGLVVAVIGIIVGFLLYDFQSHKEQLNSVDTKVKEYNKRVREMEEKVESINDTLSIIWKDLNNKENKKKR